MFIELISANRKDKHLVNLSLAQTIEPYIDECEEDEEFKTGIIVSFLNDIQKEMGHSGSSLFCQLIYHGITYDEVKELLPMPKLTIK